MQFLELKIEHFLFFDKMNEYYIAELIFSMDNEIEILKNNLLNSDTFLTLSSPETLGNAELTQKVHAPNCSARTLSLNLFSLV